MSGFQISTVLPPVRPSPPQDRESAFRKTLPVMHRRSGFSSGIFPFPIQAVRQHSAADRLILLSSIRSLRCRPGIPAPRLRPGSRHHRLCPASPESGPPIPVPSSVVFPYPAYEFPPQCHAVAWQYFVLCIVFRVSFFRFDLQFLCLTSRGTSGSAQSGCTAASHSQDSSAHPPGC